VSQIDVKIKFLFIKVYTSLEQSYPMVNQNIGRDFKIKETANYKFLYADFIWTPVNKSVLEQDTEFPKINK
jgi:hypothetical protein